MEGEPDLARRLTAVHTALLCDSLDSLGFRDAALGPDIQALGRTRAMVGRAFTIRCEAATQLPTSPYEHLIAAFDHLAEGDVIVIQTGEQVSAMWGELLTTAAIAAGVRGAVMDGLARDLDDIDAMSFPVFGTGISPMDSAGRQDVVEYGRTITCGNADVRLGDWIVGDTMGVVVVPVELAEDATALAEQKLGSESTVREELARGDSLEEVFRRHGVL